MACREPSQPLTKPVAPYLVTSFSISVRVCSAGTSVLAIGLLFACQVQGVISGAAFLQIAAAILLAILVFYTVFRSGLNLKLSDASLTEPQMLTSTVVVLCAMYSAKSGRGAFLILLLMAYLFGVLHRKVMRCARYRQVRRASRTSASTASMIKPTMLVPTAVGWGSKMALPDFASPMNSSLATSSMVLPDGWLH